MDKNLNVKRIRSKGFSDSTCSILRELKINKLAKV